MTIPFFNDIDLKGNKIFNVGEPINNTDAINKLYVDTCISNLDTDIEILIGTKTTESKAYTDEQILIVNNRIDTLDGDISTTINNAISASCINSISSTVIDKPLAANIGNVLNYNIQAVDDTVSLVQEDIQTINTNISNLSNDVGSIDSRVEVCENTLLTLNPNKYDITRTKIGSYYMEQIVDGNTTIEYVDLYRQVVVISNQSITTSEQLNILDLTTKLTDDVEIINIDAKFKTLDSTKLFFNTNVSNNLIIAENIESVNIEPIYFDITNQDLYFSTKYQTSNENMQIIIGNVIFTIDYILKNQE